MHISCYTQLCTHFEIKYREVCEDQDHPKDISAIGVLKLVLPWHGILLQYEMGLVPSKTNTKYIDAITMNLDKILTA